MVVNSNQQLRSLENSNQNVTFPRSNASATLQFFQVESPLAVSLLHPSLVALRPHFLTLGLCTGATIILEHHPSTYLLPNSIHLSFQASEQKLLLLGSLSGHSMPLMGHLPMCSDSSVWLSHSIVVTLYSGAVRFPLCLFQRLSTQQRQKPIPALTLGLTFMS